MRRQVAILALVLAATAAAYLPSIDGEFVLDDLNSIIRNPLVTDPFGHELSAWLGSIRPLTTLTFALNYLAAGLEPRGWHLTNVAIHLGVVVLGWMFVRVTFKRAGLSRPDGPALVAAGLFALHPLQTESVAYVTQRAESLASGVYLAALLLLLLWDEASTPLRRSALLAGTIALHAIGLAVKPIVATMPAAWLLHTAILPPSGERDAPVWRNVRRRLLAALPLFALSTAAAMMSLSGGSDRTAGFQVPGLPPSVYLATQLRAVPTYLRLLVWPAGQCADWYFPASAGFLEPPVLGGAAIVGAIAAAAIIVTVRYRRQNGEGPAAARAASLGALFFFLVIAPSSSVIPLNDPMAEHRVYLAALGIFVAASALGTVAARKLAGSRGVAATVALAVVMVGAAAICTARRSAVWNSSLTLWSDTAEKAPQKARVHLNLGNALYNANRPVEALASFYRARNLRRDHTVWGQTLLVNIVHTLITLGRSDEARGEVDRALVEAPRNPTALGLLAHLEYGSGRDGEAERAALSAIAVDAKNPMALKYLGMVRLRRGDVQGARDAFRAAAATRTVDAHLYWQLGDAEARSGDLEAACAAYARAAGQPGNRWASARARESHARLRCP